MMTKSKQVNDKPKRAKRDINNPKSTTKLYFTSDTQAAIVELQKCTDLKEREAIYRSRILPAFEKLVENLINIHKFSSLYDSYEDLKSDCVNFLFETIPKFDETRGTNAFSYFNVVAKNCLIIRQKQKSTKFKRNVSMDDPEALTSAELKIIEDQSIIPSQDTILERSNMSSTVTVILQDIKSKAKSENELACINSIITIFENIDDLDLINKSSTLLYMRELSGLTSKQLTATMQVIKRHWKRARQEDKLK